ncbi:MAG: hypothetical protein LLF94_00190 [Chlamydiales bacterium]|nr:hypothetical protein [Chlamydiales bacterium]
MSGSISRLTSFQIQQQAPNMVQNFLWNGKKVVAGVVLPRVMPKEIGFGGWATVLEDRLAADGYVLYAKDYQSLDNVAAIQEVIKKPIIVRYTVGTMKKQQLESISKRAHELGIHSFFFVQGPPAHKFSDIHTGVVVEDALEIFAKSQNRLLACDVPLPHERESEYVAMKQLANRVERGCNLAMIPSNIPSQLCMKYLSKWSDAITFPAVMQTVEPESVSKSKKASLDSCAALLGDSLELSKKRLTHFGAFVDLSATCDDDLEAVMNRIKGVTIASTMD